MDILFDLMLALFLFVIIILTVMLTKKFSNPWVNRKIIHLSSVPAVISYMYLFTEPYIFFSFAIFFTIMLLIPHLKNRELSWFQLKKNYGEVYYTASFAALSLILWNVDRILAGLSMLFMAVGDSATGLVRSRILKERGKHISGSIAMFIICSAIGYYFYGVKGLLLSAIATLAEYQPWVDDNISVPLLTALTGILI
ncbi:hypothetical protein [Candidatus Methanodesulfokora washburnensis]|jgi:dolichol kinase|uniref:Dolichol kinase n=2 Tax=Candidatus Methanodesulfokora washburnensis TaxID=2478471 RepID=A0A429GDL9_9CREN|nr:hypothetical protein [Candidatus Methanodesulfokores washburnensis]RSN71885.1 hypothetical protein D6D85_14960 [Candidatus Methanodesulfokores washburnensis]